MIIIRHTKIEDLDNILEIYKNAREYMRNHNNPDQWKDKFPEVSRVKKDIKEGISYLVIEDDIILGVFALIPDHDPSYDYIYEGSWISDEKYNTIHRIASSFKKRGFTKIVIDYVSSLKMNIRIDTHRNNISMQKQVLNNGFVYCGKILIDRGEERLAYEKIVDKN